MQQLFIMVIDIFLLIMIVIDVIMVIRNKKLDEEKINKDFEWELEKALMDAKKDLEIIKLLDGFNVRISNIEKQLNIKTDKEEK